MIKKAFLLLILLLIFSSLSILTFPLMVKAEAAKLDYSGWVQCDGVLTKSENSRQVTCNFSNLMRMANYLINCALIISIPIIVGLLAYSGFLHMSGKQENIKNSYKIMKNAVIGFIIMLSAWFMVSTLLKWLVKDDFKGADSLIEKQK